MHGHHPFSERVEGLSFLSNLSLTIVGRVSRECKSRRAFRVVDWRVSNAVQPAKSGRKESVNKRAQNAEDIWIVAPDAQIGRAPRREECVSTGNSRGSPSHQKTK